MLPCSLTGRTSGSCATLQAAAFVGDAGYEGALIYLARRAADLCIREKEQLATTSPLPNGQLDGPAARGLSGSCADVGLSASALLRKYLTATSGGQVCRG